MNKFQFSPDEYLVRINYSGGTEASLDALKSMHKAQIRSIAFENFDICLGRKIKVDSESVFNKLVHHKRGGYCFELNGLFLMALKHFGFDARALLGRVHVGEAPTGRGHQLSLLNLNNQHWIADVGFGADTPQAPLPLIVDKEFNIQGQIVRFINDDLFGIMLQAKKGDIWADLYSFDLNHVCDGDISIGNFYASNYPDSIFVLARVASLPRENAIVTLFNYSLKTKIGDNETTRDLEPGPAYIKVLQENFGIVLDEPYANLKDVCS